MEAVLASSERVQQRTFERATVPHTLEEAVKVGRVVPDERVQQRTGMVSTESLAPVTRK